MEQRGPDDEALTQKAAKRLAEVLPAEVDLAHIEATVRDQVRELRSTARVHNFIGVIAERNARERLLQDAARGR
jgi:hypothetical protein